MAKVEIVITAKDKASGVIKNVGGALSGLGKAALGAAAVGLAGVGAGMTAAAAAGLQFNSSMENVEAQLFAFLKDGQKVSDTLDLIRERAARTPFAFEDMARATASLIPAAKQSGKEVEELIELAEILAASNPAEGLEGAAFSLREALSGDFVSIVERFNLPRQRLKELKDEGVPALEAISIAMQELGLDAELVTNLSQTATGRLSTLKDTLMGLAATATAPLFDRLSEGLGRINEMLATPEMQARLEGIAEAIGDKLASGIDWLTDEGLPEMERWWGLARDSVITFQQAWAGDWVDSDRIHGLHRAIGRLAGGLSELEEAFMAVITAIAAVVLPALQQIAAAFGEGGLAAAVRAAGGIIQEAFGAIVATVQAQLPVWAAALQQWASAFVEWIPGAVTAFLIAWPGQLDRFLTWIGEQAGPILERLAAWTLAFVEWTVRMLPQLLLGMMAVSAAIAVWVTETAVVLLAHLAMWTASFIRWAADLLIVIGTELGKVAVKIYNWIAEVASGVPGAATGIGSGIVAGVVSGIHSAAGQIAAALGGIIDGAIASAKERLGIHSPSRVFAEEIGKPIMQGMALGIRRNIGLPQVAISYALPSPPAVPTPAPRRNLPEGTTVANRDLRMTGGGGGRSMFEGATIVLQNELGVEELAYRIAAMQRRR